MRADEYDCKRESGPGAGETAGKASAATSVERVES